MSVTYKPIHWNRQKRLYDAVLVGALALGMSGFIGVSIVLNPNITIETLLIRSTSVAALILLHVILCIGPLARLDKRFLPLLYNRRHLGVTMFLLALSHGALATFQFHALGDRNPLVSIFTAYSQDYDPFLGRPGGLSNFPFEPFGFFALVILFLMAATSHDFWLRNLGAGFWKLLHMMVYAAYGLVLVHVAYGALQSERHPIYVALLTAGFATVAGLHWLAYRLEARTDRQTAADPEVDGFVKVCPLDALEEGRGKVVRVGNERVAVFRDLGKVHALSNVCRHQGGPIGEGRIIGGCVTCPWHGWQYNPEDGASPPPFKEVIPTYRTRIANGFVYVHPERNELGTACPGAVVMESAQVHSVSVERSAVS